MKSKMVLLCVLVISVGAIALSKNDKSLEESAVQSKEIESKSSSSNKNNQPLNLKSADGKLRMMKHGAH